MTYDQHPSVGVGAGWSHFPEGGNALLPIAYNCFPVSRSLAIFSSISALASEKPYERDESAFLSETCFCEVTTEDFICFIEMRAQGTYCSMFYLRNSCERLIISGLKQSILARCTSIRSTVTFGFGLEISRGTAAAPARTDNVYHLELGLKAIFIK